MSTQLDAIKLGVSTKDEKPTKITGKALTSFYQIWNTLALMLCLQLLIYLNLI